MAQPSTASAPNTSTRSAPPPDRKKPARTRHIRPYWRQVRRAVLNLIYALSEVSQLVHGTAWARDTEFEVWRLLHEENGHWGQTGPAALEQPLECVHAWRRNTLTCWIVLDQETGRPRPIDIQSWLTLYAQWAAARRDTPAVMVDWLRKKMAEVERLAGAHRHPCDSWEFDHTVE
ncbi:hypothetical protein ACFVTC_37245 [Streptomyces sp. NPDC057950]|uniref:hypothetical protein n=1 Tax=Streptomyces sp. NPDC057950 TaxID=3346288 RepID=UPI0036E1FE3E